MRGLLSIFTVLWLAVVPALAQQFQSLDALLEAERLELAKDCKPLQFNGNFVSTHNVNGDGLDDVVLDYGGIVCNGTTTMFCGSGGCSMMIYLQGSNGSYTKLAEMLTYGFTFDRPESPKPSFVASFHGGACNRSGADTCNIRYTIRNGKLVSEGEVKDDAQNAPPDGGDGARWTYINDDEPVAGIRVSDDKMILFDCRTGPSFRMTYAAEWMIENGKLGPFVMEMAGDGKGTPVSFQIGDYQTTRQFQVDEMDDILAAEQFLEPSDPLLAALMAGNWVTVMHGGDIALESQFSLAGSSAALKSLIAACR